MKKHHMIEQEAMIHYQCTSVLEFSKRFLAAVKAASSDLVHFQGTFFLSRLFSGANTVEWCGINRE